MQQNRLVQGLTRFRSQRCDIGQTFVLSIVAYGLRFRSANDALTDCSLYTAFCRAWPNIDAIDQKWKRLQNPLLQTLCSANVVYTKASGGKWLKVEDAILDRLDEHQPKELLVNVLLEAHQNVATLPGYVLEAFNACNKPVIKEITPMLVRQILKESPSSYRNLGRLEKLNLLAFILNCTDENFADLIGLELLPVSSGAFKCFASFSNCDDAVYVCSPDHPRKLFPCLEHQFLDQDLDQTLFEIMGKVAKKGMNDSEMFWNYKKLFCLFQPTSCRSYSNIWRLKLSFALNFSGLWVEFSQFFVANNR